MGHLPRKIELNQVIGFVYCKCVGVLFCGDEADKGNLLALGKIYLKGMKRGSITQTGGLPQFNSKTTLEEQKTVQVTMDHLIINLPPYQSLFKSNEETTKLSLFLKSLNKELLFISKEEMKKYFMILHFRTNW